MIAWGHPQIPIGGCVIDHLELAEHPGFQVRRDVARTDVIHEERPQPVIPETDDHPNLKCELMYHSMGHRSRYRAGFDSVAPSSIREDDGKTHSSRRNAT